MQNFLIRVMKRESAKLESDAMEASNQAYVALPKKDSEIRFTMTKPADAVDIRYTVPENKKAEVEILFQKKGENHWESLQTVQLDGSRAWQYIRENKAYDTKVSGARTRFRFDETHFLLKKNTGERVHLEEGDVLAIRNKEDGNPSTGIDFIEMEEAGEVKERLESIHHDDTMEYSEGDGTKVFNFMPTDIPEYIPITGTDFVEEYHYDGEDWIRWENDGQVEYVKIRYWSKK